jgi:hypothetical protein
MSSDPLTAAVRRALRGAPCTTRALAVEADVPHSTLVRIAAGTRNATPAVALAVARALESWGKRSHRLALGIHAIIQSSSKRG